MTKHALPYGMPTMDTNATTPTSHHARPINAPPRINHRKSPIARIGAFPEFKPSGCRLSPARFDSRSRAWSPSFLNSIPLVFAQLSASQSHEAQTGSYPALNLGLLWEVAGLSGGLSE